MTLKQAYTKVAKAAREIARELRKARKFKYKAGYCIADGVPCCVFGDVLKRAGLLKNENLGWVVGNSAGLQRAIEQFHYPYEVPDPIAAAAAYVGSMNDDPSRNPKDPTEHRRRVADALDQFSSVVKATTASTT